MRVVKLETTGVRGLADAAWTLTPEREGPGNATVITGPPSCGLTTFLEAIAMSAARLAVGGSPPRAEEVLRPGGTTATVRSTWWLDADERAFGGTTEETTNAEVVWKRNELGQADGDPVLLGLMSRYDHSPTTSKVVYIPARRVTDSGVPSFLDFEVDQQYKRFSGDPDKFAALPGALVKHAAGLGERARFEAVQRLFGELVDSVQLAGTSARMAPDFSLRGGARVPLERLGFAERNAFVLAAVPVLLGLQHAVILLDTPELGLAPGVAARWLGALRRFAPEAQWIVASRDPALVASVDGAARIDLARGAA